MPGNPTDYASWPKYAGYERDRKALWDRVEAHKRDHGGRLPWTVPCDFCDEAAVACIAADISKPGTLRVAFCGKHSRQAVERLRASVTGPE
jgi:hypothetical protein